MVKYIIFTKHFIVSDLGQGWWWLGWDGCCTLPAGLRPCSGREKKLDPWSRRNLKPGSRVLKSLFNGGLFYLSLLWLELVPILPSNTKHKILCFFPFHWNGLLILFRFFPPQYISVHVCKLWLRNIRQLQLLHCTCLDSVPSKEDQKTMICLKLDSEEPFSEWFSFPILELKLSFVEMSYRIEWDKFKKVWTWCKLLVF